MDFLTYVQRYGTKYFSAGMAIPYFFNKGVVGCLVQSIHVEEVSMQIKGKKRKIPNFLIVIKPPTD